MKKKFKSVKCRTKFCRGRTMESGHSCYCSKCRTRRWADKYFLNYAFANLRHRAKQRQKEFDLTRSDFIELAQKSGLDKLHGRGKFCLTIDRRDNDKGYTKSNVRAILKTDNSSRQKYIPFFKNKAAEQEAITEADKRAAIALKISDELEKQFHPDSDEFRAAYTQRTNAAFATV